MRVSFLVLAGVIAVCNTDASAKAVAPAAEDEANGVGQGPAQQDPQNDTAYETAVKKSNILGESILSKRYVIPDSGKRRSVIKKKSEKKRKTESKKFEVKKFEEHKTRSVKNKTRTSSRRTEKGESQAKNRHGFVSNDWFMPQYNSKTVAVPVIYKGPHKYHAPWALQANFAVGADQENKALPAKELVKIEELAEIFHNSLKGGLESLFGVLGKELRKKIEKMDAKPDPNGKTRSVCVDKGDGSNEGVYADGAEASSLCWDDSQTTANESGNGIGPSDMSKRSGESPLEYLQQTLPVVIQAVQAILAESEEDTRPPGEDKIVEDYDRRSSDAGYEAEEPATDHGIDNESWDSWSDDDFNQDHDPAE